MTSQHGKQIITRHILLNILRSKSNEIMKFGHLTEYNLRNIFLEKIIYKMWEEIIPLPFSKKSKFSISLDFRATDHLLLPHIKPLKNKNSGISFAFPE